MPAHLKQLGLSWCLSTYDVRALLEQIEEQVEIQGKPSDELLSCFREFCEAHGEKVDRIGRFVRMMEAREQYCRSEAARLSERARATRRMWIEPSR